MIRGVGVVVPVHNEEALLGACLYALRRACRTARPHVRTHVVVVLDSCSDRSAKIADRFATSDGFAVVRVDSRNVGAARRVGVRRVLEHFMDLQSVRTWIATTDADSIVPKTWVVDQLRLASEGAHAMAGTIRVRADRDHRGAPARAFREFYDALGGDVSHGHIHGANFGVRADAYRLVGGFAPIPTGEDQAIFRALKRNGCAVVSTRRVQVRTSGRLSGRAPEGFADFLSKKFFSR